MIDVTAALTIAVLRALSVSVVRVAGVAMRLTGLPEAVARFQCSSALTGTGFTTHKALEDTLMQSASETAET